MSEQQKQDGGPAFPVPVDFDARSGMTLRDYFAAKAMQGFTSVVRAQDIHAADRQVIAIIAYQIADAMLKERAK